MTTSVPLLGAACGKEAGFCLTTEFSVQIGKVSAKDLYFGLLFSPLFSIIPVLSRPWWLLPEF